MSLITKVYVYWWQRNAQDKTPSPMGPFLVTKSIFESSLDAFMVFFLPSWMRVPWIREVPLQRKQKRDIRFARSSYGQLLDFGCLGLVLGPLIQGRMRAGLSGTHVQLNGKCRKIVFSSMRCSKFSGKYRILYMILWLIYHRFYKNYLFLFVGLYKTRTDETVNTTRRNPHTFYMGFARDLPSGLLDFVENFTKSGVSVRKRWAVHLLNTLKIYM